MLTQEDIKRAIQLEDAASGVGAYLDTSKSTPSYRIRDMHKYCKIHGKDIEKLTAVEREQFRVSPKT